MRQARNRKVYEAEGVRFEPPPAPVLQIVEHPAIAAYNAAAEEGSLDLGGHLAGRRARTAAAFRDGLDPAHYVALTRARLQTLFGAPASRGDGHKSSFHYEIAATTSAGQVYFLVGDHKASDVLIFWEYSTSSPDARRIAEQAFWTLIAATAPSEFDDVFAWEETAGLRYGYRAGRPWVTLATVAANLGRPARVAQPTGRVSLAGIATLTTGGLAGFLTATNLAPTAALAVGLGTWILVSVLWQRGRSGE